MKYGALTGYQHYRQIEEVIAVKILVVLPYVFSNEEMSGGAQSMMWGHISALRNLGFTFRILSIKHEQSCSGEPGLELRQELDEFSVMAPDPAALARNIAIFMNSLEGIDLIWTLDRPFPLVVKHPVLMSYSTMGIYPDESVGLFDTNWDGLLVFSRFSLEEISRLLPHHAAMVRPPRIEVVSAGIHPSLQVRSDRSWLAEWLGHMPGRKYVLFPHRPEAAKGHRLAIDVITELVDVDTNFHLLIPEPPVGSKFEEKGEAEFIVSLKSLVDSRRLTEHVTFHTWVPRADRGRYYAGGTVCLHLSTLPETFGLSAVEAVAVGVPVISLGTGALPEVLPPGGAHLVMSDQSPGAIARTIRQGLPSLSCVAKESAALFEVHGLPTVGKRLATLIRTLTKADRRFLGSGAN